MGWLIDGKGEMFLSPPAADANEGTSLASISKEGGTSVQSGFIGQQSSLQQVSLPSHVSVSDGKNIDKPLRRIAEIRVFYDDGTFETFSAKV